MQVQVESVNAARRQVKVQVPAATVSRSWAQVVRRIGARVRMLNRLVSRIYDDELREHGIRFSQLNILTIIAMKGPIERSEVGRILAIEKSTLSRNVRLMEENGWLTTASTDRSHAQPLILTRDGKQLYQRASASWTAAQKKVKTLLGAQAASGVHDAVNRAQQP